MTKVNEPVQIALDYLALAAPPTNETMDHVRTLREALKCDTEEDDNEENFDNMGHIIVNHISSIVNAGWDDEFQNWYKPEEWLGSHRAACEFIGKKYNERYQRDLTALKIILGCLENEVEISNVHLFLRNIKRWMSIYEDDQ